MRVPAFLRRAYAVLARLSPGYPPLRDTFRCITHPFAARRQGCPRAAARLACVKHAASVQSEPGSNSSVRSLQVTQSTLAPFPSPSVARLRTGTRHFASYEHQNFLNVSPESACIAVSSAAGFDQGTQGPQHPHLSVVKFLKNRPGGPKRREPPAERRDYTSNFGSVNSPFSLLLRLGHLAGMRSGPRPSACAAMGCAGRSGISLPLQYGLLLDRPRAAESALSDPRHSPWQIPKSRPAHLPSRRRSKEATPRRRRIRIDLLSSLPRHSRCAPGYLVAVVPGGWSRAHRP